MANWFVSMAGTEQGPFTDRQLKQLAVEGRLGRTDLVRREDQQKGCEAQKLKGLFEVPPPLPPGSIQQAKGMPVQPPQIQVHKRIQLVTQSKSAWPKVAIGCGAIFVLFVSCCAGLGVIGSLIEKNKNPILVQAEENQAAEVAEDQNEDPEELAIRILAMIVLKVGKGRNHWTPEEFITYLRQAASQMGASKNPKLKHLLTIEPSFRELTKNEDGEVFALVLRFGEPAGDKTTLIVFRSDPDGYHFTMAKIGGKTYFVNKDNGTVLLQTDSGFVKVYD